MGSVAVWTCVLTQQDSAHNLFGCKVQLGSSRTSCWPSKSAAAAYIYSAAASLSGHCAWVNDAGMNFDQAADRAKAHQGHRQSCCLLLRSFCA